MSTGVGPVVAASAPRAECKGTALARAACHGRNGEVHDGGKCASGAPLQFLAWTEFGCLLLNQPH